jgi:predicted RNA polymerase sigma factor
MAAAETHQAIETVFRIERAKLIAGLARMVRDVGLAEELAQDACVIALSEWPKSGVPGNPGAWLMAAAKRRAIDASRRNRMLARKHEEIGLPVSRTSKRPWTMTSATSFSASSSLPAIRCCPPRRARP